MNGILQKINGDFVSKRKQKYTLKSAKLAQILMSFCEINRQINCQCCVMSKIHPCQAASITFCRYPSSVSRIANKVLNRVHKLKLDQRLLFSLL